jgi:hypothetical protein
VVAAGVGDDSTGNLFVRELQNLVGRAADFEGADGLEAFRLEPDCFTSSMAGEAGESGADERGFDGDRGDAGGGGADLLDGDKFFCLCSIIFQPETFALGIEIETPFDFTQGRHSTSTG